MRSNESVSVGYGRCVAFRKQQEAGCPSLR